MVKIKRVLAFDPGFGGTGWAMCFKRADGVFGVNDAGIFKPSGNEEAIEDRVLDVRKRTQKLFDSMFEFGGDGYGVAIELPKYMPSPTGQAAASGGNLVTLFLCVAGIISATHAEKRQLKLVDVNEWKGTMSKEAVISRIKKRFAAQRMQVAFRSHEWDAVGVGLHVLGVF